MFSAGSKLSSAYAALVLFCLAVTLIATDRFAMLPNCKLPPVSENARRFARAAPKGHSRAKPTSRS